MFKRFRKAEMPRPPAPSREGFSAPLFSDVFPDAKGGCEGIGFVLGAVKRGPAPLLWVQDHLSRRESGRPCLAGLGRRPLLYASLSRAADVLWTMEEGLRCRGLSAVIGEIWGQPEALSFTATRRLAMRAEESGTACWLIRHGAAPGLSAARARWRVSPLPSLADPHDPRAPGEPRWRVELFRSRLSKPGIWVVHHDRKKDCLDISAGLPDGALATDAGAGGRSALG